METPEKRKADALASVSGFAFHIQDAIRNTPAEAVSRSRIVDRCAHGFDMASTTNLCPYTQCPSTRVVSAFVSAL